MIQKLFYIHLLVHQILNIRNSLLLRVLYAYEYFCFNETRTLINQTLNFNIQMYENHKILAIQNIVHA